MSERVNRNGWNLAIETSGRIGSVAIGRGDGIVAEATFSADQRHAVELLPTIDRLCREQNVTPDQVDECYVSGGPGSFTGVRIGITAARALSLAGGVRIVRVPTLDVIAQNALECDPPPPHLGVVLDAKRKRVFAAAYTLGPDLYERIGAPAERDPAEFFAELPRSAALMGEGVQYAVDPVKQCGLTALSEDTYRARAAIVHRLGKRRASQGDFDDARALVPIYIRRPEAEEVWEKRHGQ